MKPAQPTPNPSEEESNAGRTLAEFPSWEGSGVGYLPGAFIVRQNAE